MLEDRLQPACDSLGRGDRKNARLASNDGISVLMSPKNPYDIPRPATAAMSDGFGASGDAAMSVNSEHAPYIATIARMPGTNDTIAYIKTRAREGRMRISTIPAIASSMPNARNGNPPDRNR